VLQDMLGFDPDFTPTFLQKYANFYEQTISAVQSYCSQVEDKTFPSAEQSFK